MPAPVSHRHLEKRRARLLSRQPGKLGEGRGVRQRRAASVSLALQYMFQHTRTPSKNSLERTEIFAGVDAEPARWYTLL